MLVYVVSLTSISNHHMLGGVYSSVVKAKRRLKDFDYDVDKWVCYSTPAGEAFKGWGDTKHSESGWLIRILPYQVDTRGKPEILAESENE